MRTYAFLFLLVGLAAAIVGFGIIAGTAALIAKLLFVLCLILFAYMLFRSWQRRP